MKKKKYLMILFMLILMLGIAEIASAVATLSSIVINDDNDEVVITFSEAVSSSNAGQVALVKGDLSLTLTDDNGSSASINAWGVATFTHEFPWTTVTASLDITGTVYGLEELTIDVVAASVYDTSDHSALANGDPNQQIDYLNNAGKPVWTSVVINLANSSAVLTFDKAVLANSDFQDDGTQTALTDGVGFTATLVGGTRNTLTSWGDNTFTHTEPFNTITVDLDIDDGTADGLEVLTITPIADMVYSPDGTVLPIADTQIDNLHREGAITMYVNNETPLEYETIDAEDPTVNTNIYTYTASATEVWVDDDLNASYQANDIIEVVSGTGDKAYAEIARFDSDDGRHIYLSAAFAGGSTPVVGDELNFVDMTDTVNDDGPLADQPFKYLSTALANIWDTDHDDSESFEDYHDGDIIIIADGTYKYGPYTVPHSCTIRKANATDKADYSNFSPVIKTTTTNADIFDITADMEVYFKGLTIVCNGTGKGIDIATWTAADVDDGEGIIAEECYFYNAAALSAISGAGTDDTHKLPVTASLNWWNTQAAGNVFTTANAEAVVDNTTNVTRILATILGSQDAASGGDGATGGEFESGDQDTEADFVLSDGGNSYHVKITPTAFPRTDDGSEQLFTVNRWNICPPGRTIYTPPYDAYYYSNCYFEVDIDESKWPDRKWNADVKVLLATGQTNSHFENVQLMRYETYGEAFSGWVAVPGATLIDGDGSNDYLDFEINREGVYCFVKPNTPANNFGVYIGETQKNSGSTPTKLLRPNSDGTYSWPLTDSSYDPYDWDISNYQDEVTFHVSPMNGLDMSQIDMLIKWDGDCLQLQTFSWGTLMSDPDAAYGSNPDVTWQKDYNILGSEDGVRVSASIQGYNSGDNVQSNGAGGDGADDDFFTLTFKYLKPGFAAIYSEYLDIRKFCSTDNYVDKIFSVPVDAAYINRLGDVRNSWDQTYGDGLVNSEDLALWSLSYWAGVSGSQVSVSDYYKFKYDIGPTTNDWYDGWPIQDTDIEFEDLNIFAMNYGRTGEGAMMVKGEEMLPPQIEFGNVTTSRSSIEIPIIVQGPVADFRSASFKIDYNHSLLEFAGAYQGSLLADFGPTFMKAQEINENIWCDMAVLGGNNEGINTPGELVVLCFDVLHSGDDYNITFTDMKLRNSRNQNMFEEDPEQPQPDLPTNYSLSNNFPNPFTNTTTIKYQIPNSSHVDISVYNIRGQKVTTLVNENKNAGFFSTNFDAHNLSTGLYFYRIQAGEFEQTNKMLIVR